MVREQALDRVAEGFIVPHADMLVDYYLAFVISAEVGVLVRWLSAGMREPVGIVARMMTAMLFVRPGDLYGRPIGFDIPTLAPQLVSQRTELLNGSDN
ncbi:MAG: TetR family transcriptional regulator C-terminal domain-containing protein, partial [Atopobiaceae bacterium]|nr:TetR family transcriptional regulator C-terminal domain-containing protein [Atopobiaceae bacterium]